MECRYDKNLKEMIEISNSHQVYKHLENLFESDPVVILSSDLDVN